MGKQLWTGAGTPGCLPLLLYLRDLGVLPNIPRSPIAVAASPAHVCPLVNSFVAAGPGRMVTACPTDHRQLQDRRTSSCPPPSIPTARCPAQAGAQRGPLSVWDVCPSHCHGQIAFRGALPAFPRLDPKRTAFFLRNRLFVLEGFCCYLLTSLNCITPRYASDLHSLNPALFGRICHYSN